MTEYSVIIPAYNAEQTLRETLDSILSQTSPPREIIVVDDGSTDRTAELAVAASPRVRVVRQTNTGPGAATSRGIHETMSALVALSDADDIWLPQKMEIQLQVLATNPGIAMVSTWMRQFRHGQIDDDTGEVRSGPTRTTAVMRREVFFHVGEMIDPPGGCGDMVDWLGRFRSLGHRMFEVQEVLALRRIISGSLSYRNAERLRESFLAVAHRALVRRRAA